ncbi:phosphatase PAP2 family protein [Geomonas sp. Red32]|uniref:phosphatase PAP2 family protein n=1 Tax=Geomonas sp. Red32 TaxID=2912856 RepID=UPI00202D0B9D|nr:phosphatase PAP2 family protein [Geomonas sp. Red32]MCM0082247.1 phosphatase PAP2 family protein [Geomonas sp. Red32]
MTNRRFLQRWIRITLVAGPLTYLCVSFLDLPVAHWVKRNLFSIKEWQKRTTDLPDLLLASVVAVTAAAGIAYLVRRRRGIDDSLTRLCHLAAWTAPVSFAMKQLLKLFFGRTTTRDWLEGHEAAAFHWFRGNEGWVGFPSGHMLVAAALLAAAARFFPWSRGWALAGCALLAVALMLTSYHFLSDVLAGIYFGLATEATVCQILFGGAPQLAGRGGCRAPDGCR